MTCAARYPMWQRDVVTLDAPPSARAGSTTSGPRGLGFFLIGDPVPQPREAPGERLALRVGVDDHVRAGQPIALTLAMSNASRASMFVMRPLYCSFTHQCQPTYDLYVREESSGRVYRWDYDGRVGCAIEGLTPGNMVSLEAGETRDDLLDAWEGVDGVTIRRPGRYTLWMVYRLCGIAQPFAALSESERRSSEPDWFQSLAHGVFASNAVTFTVDPLPRVAEASAASDSVATVVQAPVARRFLRARAVRHARPTRPARARRPPR